MIKSVFGKAPDIAQAAFVAESAAVIGAVTLGKDSSLWYGAVLRADTAAITVGEGSNIQDNAVLHTGPGLDVTIGSHVSVGHSAVVHGCTVEDEVLVGMHATLMNGCVIGKGSIIAAGALVSQNTVIPPHSMVVGVPGKVVRQISQEQLEKNRTNAANYVRLAREHDR